VSEQVRDYAIVGGGISGVYSAWRLKESNRDLAIDVFETSDRVGGRLLTVIPPNIPSARVELGGMRYIVEEHPWVNSLVQYLGLTTEQLPAGEPQNFAYARGKLLRMNELADASKIPYDVSPLESSPGVLTNLTAQAAALSLAPTIEELLGIKVSSWNDLNLTSAQWQTIATKGTYEGAPLASLPMRYLMLRSMSKEALQLDEDTGGYDSILYTWNAADGFPWNLGDFTPTTTYVRIQEGYDEVPLMLAERFHKAGGTIRLGAHLESFDMADDGTVRLEIVEDGSAQTVFTKRLILALPRRSLELLDQTGAVLGPENREVHELIRSVTPIPLFKLAVCYPSPWWESLPPVQLADGPNAPWVPISNGKSVTDLPIRQCYYWAVDPKTNCAVLLVYDDGRDLDYWAGLRDSRAPSFESAVAEDGSSEWSKHPAPQRMVDEIHRQLLEMHGITDTTRIPAPYAAAYRDWGEDPYGGGANFWHVGVRSYEVAEKIIQPKPPHPVYICGESYSHGQGWAEGALETAETMLQQHFGLPTPPWKKEAETAKEPAAAAAVTAS
jgi:monoamine oxidase